MKINKLLLFSILILSLFVSSCSEETPEEKKPYLVSDSQKYEQTRTMLQEKIPSLEFFIKSGIRVLKIKYRTEYEGREIIASGTLSLPDVAGSYPLALVQRGTILSNSQAPSESEGPSYELFSSFGYIVFVPDLTGYGSSVDVLHPYFDYLYTAGASVDMYYAVNEFIEKELDYDLNGKFFISGYSQGGYSAMASYKYMEENIPEIEITAVGAGAGAYDLQRMVDSVVSYDSYPFPILLAMPLVTYNVLDLDYPLGDIFNSPYDGYIQEVVDGGAEWWLHASEYPHDFEQFFNSGLITDLRAGVKTIFTDALAENSVHDWAPQKPLRLYHYPQDEIIPLGTTLKTVEKMKKNGAVDVEYVEISSSMVPQGGSAHGSAGNAGIFLSFLEFSKY